MRVQVIDGKCQGHGRCYGLAPEVFDADDLGNAVVLNDGVVPAGSEANARLAAENCPEYALEVDES